MVSIFHFPSLSLHHSHSSLTVILSSRLFLASFVVHAFFRSCHHHLFPCLSFSRFPFVSCHRLCFGSSQNVFFYNWNAQNVFITYYYGESNKTQSGSFKCERLQPINQPLDKLCIEPKKKKKQNESSPNKISHKILKEIQTADHTDPISVVIHAPNTDDAHSLSLCEKHKRPHGCCSMYK